MVYPGSLQIATQHRRWLRPSPVHWSASLLRSQRVVHCPIPWLGEAAPISLRGGIFATGSKKKWASLKMDLFTSFFGWNIENIWKHHLDLEHLASGKGTCHMKWNSFQCNVLSTPATTNAPPPPPPAEFARHMRSSLPFWGDENTTGEHIIAYIHTCCIVHSYMY